MFRSEAHSLGQFKLPQPKDLRIMMMPFDVENQDSLAEEQVGGYRSIIFDILSKVKRSGIGYVTIDETLVKAGTTHRRPGLHVDGGFGSYGGPAPYSHEGPIHRTLPYGGSSYASSSRQSSVYGGSPSYGSCGMIIIANNNGTRAFLQDFEGEPGAEGDCEHLRVQCKQEVIFGDNEAWGCGALCVHEAVTMKQDTYRQIMRISLPSDAPYHWPYTHNITGVVPITKPGPDRTVFMNYRS